MTRYLIAGFALFLGLVWLLKGPSVSVPVTRIATVAPVQSPTTAPPFTIRSYTLTPVAEFTVTARLLSKSTYHFDRESELSPIDYALGWQSMAQPFILKEISIGQGRRFYHWHTRTFPIPRNDIETQSANMHLIPASPDIEAQLKSIPEDNLVRLKGFLVNISAPDGWHWNSSTTRGDTGDGACEVFYVQSVARGL